MVDIFFFLPGLSGYTTVELHCMILIRFCASGGILAKKNIIIDVFLKDFLSCHFDWIFFLNIQF